MSDSKPSSAAGPGGILNSASFSLVPHLCLFSPLPYLCSVSPLVGIPFIFELRNTLINVWKWTLTFILHFVEKASFSHLLMVNICYPENAHGALLTGIEKCPLMHHKCQQSNYMYYIGNVFAEGWTPWSHWAAYMFPFHSEMLTFYPRQALDQVKTEGDAAEDVNVQMVINL